MWRLSVAGKQACDEAIRQLSECRYTVEEKEARWICPGISIIELKYSRQDEEAEDENYAALLTLIKDRWASGRSSEASIPERLHIRCSKASFPRLWDLEQTLTALLPTFKLFDVERFSSSDTE